MLVATYDYWGYYNICFLGDEVKEPGQNHPAGDAAIHSVGGMSIRGDEHQHPGRGALAGNHAARAVESRLVCGFYFHAKIYGTWAAKLVTGLVMWTAFASVFSLMLGYSRVPYAAALDGNYFQRVRAGASAGTRFPYVSLLALGCVAVLFCFLSLADVIAALVVIRIMLQFLVQAIGLIVLRIRRPDLPRPFRMWLYPLPALAGESRGFLFILISRTNFAKADSLCGGDPG